MVIRDFTLWKSVSDSLTDSSYGHTTTINGATPPFIHYDAGLSETQQASVGLTLQCRTRYGIYVLRSLLIHYVDNFVCWAVRINEIHPKPLS